MRRRGSVGDEEEVGRAAEQPGERRLHPRGAEAGGDPVQYRRLKGPVKGRV